MKNFLRGIYHSFLSELLLIKGDVGILIFFLVLPLSYPLLYSLIYNPELVRDVPVVVVDNDRTQLSRELVRRMDATQGTLIYGYALDLPDARRAVNEHKAYGILEIPEGFAKSAGRGEQAEAVLYCEMSLMLRYKAILVSATDVMMNLGATITTQRINEIAPLAGTIATGDLLGVTNVQLGNIEGGFDSFIMPGVLILILQQAMILAIGMCGGALREYPRKAFFGSERRLPGVGATMLGQTLAFFIVMIVPTIYIMHYVPLMFKFPMAGNVFQELLFLLPMIFAACGLGFIIQGAVRERESIFVLWVVTSIIFLFLSGLTWPTYAMKGFWHFLSDCVPASWGVQGFIKMNSNGASLAQVAPEYINLWILAISYYILGYLMQRFVQRPAVLKAAAALQTP